MTMITVIEPHALLRLGILQLLSDLTPGLKLEGSDYSSFTRGPETRQCDMVLLSVSDTEPLTELVAAAERTYSPKSIILLAENKTLPDGLHGLSAAVAGYITKCAAPDVFRASIQLVLAGGSCFPLRAPAADLSPPPPLSSSHYHSRPQASASEPSTQRRAACPESEMLGLTPRQYEVLVLLARGYPLKTVGRYLNISVATAKAHTETLYQRLDVHNRNAAVYTAVSLGAKLGWPSIGGAPDPTLHAPPNNKNHS